MFPRRVIFFAAVLGLANPSSVGPVAAQTWDDLLGRGWSRTWDPAFEGDAMSAPGWGAWSERSGGSRYPWRNWSRAPRGEWGAGDWPRDEALPGAGMTLTWDSRRLMRAHGQNVVVLGLMFTGRQTFDRGVAARLAREIERASGEEMWRRYMPGTPRDGEVNRTLIWQYFLTFRKYAEALRAQATRLARGLERPLRPEDVQAGNFWVPPSPAHPTQGAIGAWRDGGGAVTRSTALAFWSLVVVCQDCHTQFRVE